MNIHTLRRIHTNTYTIIPTRVQENLPGITDLDPNERTKILTTLTNEDKLGKRSSTASLASSSGTIDLTDDLSPKKQKLVISEEEDPVLFMYNKMKLDELKDFMRWNNAPVGGTKIELVQRAVDGHNLGVIFLQIVFSLICTHTHSLTQSLLRSLSLSQFQVPYLFVPKQTAEEN